VPTSSTSDDICAVCRPFGWRRSPSEVENDVTFEHVALCGSALEHRRHRQGPLRPRHPADPGRRQQQLVSDDVRVTRRLDGIPARAADLARIKIGQLIEKNLAADVLDSRDWSGIGRVACWSGNRRGAAAATP
jgi:hypothetical protein